MNPYLRLWAMALAAAILFAFGRPAQAQLGETDTEALPGDTVIWSGGVSARAESWQAMLQRRDNDMASGTSVGTASGMLGGTTRFGLALDFKSGPEGRPRGLQWRMKLDDDSTLALRLRSRKVSVQWRKQF